MIVLLVSCFLARLRIQPEDWEKRGEIYEKEIRDSKRIWKRERHDDKGHRQREREREREAIRIKWEQRIENEPWGSRNPAHDSRRRPSLK